MTYLFCFNYLFSLYRLSEMTKYINSLADCVCFEHTSALLIEEEFEDTKGVTRKINNTMVKRKRTNGQTTIYKAYI